MSSRWVKAAVIAVAVAILVAAGVLTCVHYAPRQTPEGQPPLAVIQDGDTSVFEDAFNASTDRTRVVTLLSPT